MEEELLDSQAANSAEAVDTLLSPPISKRMYP